MSDVSTMAKYLDQLNARVWTFRNQFSPVPEYEFDCHGEIQHNYTPIQWTPSAVFNLVLSGVVGAVLGVFIAMCVNTALVEVSVSSSFAIYFGILFVFVGLVILWRTFTQSNIPGLPDDVAAARVPRRHLLHFACLNIATGIFCFMVERSSLLGYPAAVRFVIYGVLGMSSAFALTFGLVDLMNLVTGFIRPESARPLVESVLQIYLVIGSSLMLGAVFGCLFSVIDVGPSSLDGTLLPQNVALRDAPSVQLANLIDERLCLPIGILWGSLAGLANEYVARVEASYNKLDQLVEFDADI